MIKDTEKTGFPARLKKLRSEKGFSQTTLAELVKMHNTHISRYERGESKPSSQALKKLADCLDVSTDYLYDGEEVDAIVADFKDKEFLNIFKEAEELSEEDKFIIKKLLQAFINNKKIQKLAS